MFMDHVKSNLKIHDFLAIAQYEDHLSVTKGGDDDV